jgi:hypothetical protein
VTVTNVTTATGGGTVSTTEATVTGWTGWLRIGRRPRRRVADGLNKDEVLMALMKAADADQSKNKDLVILPAGTDPNARPVKHARVAEPG